MALKYDIAVTVPTYAPRTSGIETFDVSKSAKVVVRHYSHFSQDFVSLECFTSADAFPVTLVVLASDMLRAIHAATPS